MPRNIQLVNVLQRQFQEVMFVFPGDLGFGELFPLDRGRRGVCDLGDQVSSGSLRDTVHEHANERNFQNDGKCKGKSKQDTLSVQEPSTLLFRGERDPAEVRFELGIVSASFLIFDGMGSHKFTH